MSAFSEFLKAGLRRWRQRRSSWRTLVGSAKHSKPIYSRHVSGIWGEDAAAAFLKKKGFAIIGRRVKEYRDEIDIVAEARVGGAKQLVFVEVKTRGYDAFGGGRAAVDTRKRRILCRAAAHYLRRCPKAAFRFDIIEVIGNPDSSEAPQIRHFENAFPMDRRFFFAG